MLELFGIQIGTLSQIGTFSVLLVILGGLLTVWVRGIPERVRVRMELGTATVDAWKALEARVKDELLECKRQREEDARIIAAHNETIEMVRNENFRVKLALDITLDELLRSDPENAAVRRAKAVMLVAVRPQKVGNGK